jgi:DNA polymerase-4
MTILGDFTPYVEPGGLEEAYLDITGCEMYGSARRLAVSLKERIKRELELIASVGIASCKIVAKIASDFDKPDGLVEVPEGGEKEFLAPLPISRLPGVGKKTEQALNALGITTIGQLADLPPGSVRSRFGAAGSVLHRYANGIDDRKLESPGEARSISRETTLTTDTLDRNLLYGILSYLCERVGAELRRHNKQARSISLKLRYSDFETVNRSRSSGDATDTDDVIFKTARRLLDRTLAGTQKQVRLIGVEVSNLVGEGKQLNLFDSRAQHQEALNKAVDRIRKKYGFSTIQTGRTLALKDIFESVR